ncbi:MAG: FliA/WhiG family RNA polymerase sigma factor [Peptostreptococcaceae bacterium]|nr:FliA/WhiG family RNA polymerase sigma factor [Peptostreptococcaceae bacterium]
MQGYTNDIWYLYKNETNKDNKSKYKEEIIIKYVDLVKIVASKLFNYYAQKIEYEDLVGYGIIGLIDAIDKFDYTKNIKFETYASIRIKGAIMDEIRNQDWVPRAIRQKSKQLNNAIKTLEDKLCREATKEEIAQYMNISIDELLKLIDETSTFNIMSIEEEIADNYKIQIIDTNIKNSPENQLIYNDNINELAKAIDTLNDKEKLIINLYYYENLTYKEISEIVGLSESRISQIISVCLSKLKKILIE